MTEQYERRKLLANIRKRRLQPTHPIYFAAQRLSSTKASSERETAVSLSLNSNASGGCLPSLTLVVRRTMFNIPSKFRDIPEAKRVREAEAQFDAAVEREKVLSKTSGQQVYLVSTYLQRVQCELQEAQDAFDAAAGLPEVVPLSQTVLDEIAEFFGAEQCQEAIALLEKRCGRTIPFQREATSEQLEPYRLSVLRRSQGNVAELRKWIEFANIEGFNVLL